MSMHKRKQIEAEDERIILFQEQQLIREAYQAEQEAKQKEDAIAYAYISQLCGLS